jgi:hypothetical protein
MGMTKSPLELELAAITEEFVARIVAALRNASFGDVAALSPAAPMRRAPSAPTHMQQRTRRSGATREAIAERIVGALRASHAPMNARAIADALGVAPDKLALPLKSLRDAGHVKKHGDKRATTYSAS